MQDFNINYFYDLYKKEGFFDDMFVDFSIKEYEADILVKTLRKYKPKKILMIGVFKGFSTLITLKENPIKNASIICIDPFFENYYAGNNYGSVYKKMIQKYDLNKQVKTIQGFATVPGNEVFDLTTSNKNFFNPELWFKIDETMGKFDLIFIDGDHAYNTAIIDFVKSVKMINDGGVVLIHDTADKLWKPELVKLLDYIKKLSNCQLKNYDQGINGMAVVIFSKHPKLPEYTPNDYQ